MPLQEFFWRKSEDAHKEATETLSSEALSKSDPTTNFYHNKGTEVVLCPSLYEKCGQILYSFIYFARITLKRTMDSVTAARIGDPWHSGWHITTVLSH